MVKVQQSKGGALFLTVPQTKAQLLGLKKGDIMDCEIDRINKTLVFVPIRK